MRNRGLTFTTTFSNTKVDSHMRNAVTQAHTVHKEVQPCLFFYFSGSGTPSSTFPIKIKVDVLLSCILKPDETHSSSEPTSVAHRPSGTSFANACHLIWPYSKEKWTEMAETDTRPVSATFLIHAFIISCCLVAPLSCLPYFFLPITWVHKSPSPFGVQ